MEIGVENMNSDIKIRKVNQTDATKWFKFVNKVWRSAYKSIFPEEVFQKKKKMLKRRKRISIKKYVIGVLKDNKKARAVYEKWGGKLSTYEEDFYKMGVAYKEVFYIYDL